MVLETGKEKKDAVLSDLMLKKRQVGVAVFKASLYLIPRLAVVQVAVTTAFL